MVVGWETKHGSVQGVPGKWTSLECELGVADGQRTTPGSVPGVPEEKKSGSGNVLGVAGR